jgi:hypothetical protein
MSDHQERFIALVIELIAVPSDERESEILEELNRLSPDPEYMDYIYHSDEFYRDDETLNVTALAERVFSYKPIIL